jgi:hypothetical protein
MAKARLFLTRFCLGWLVFVPLMTVWEVVQYWGPYRWLCEWQLSLGGEYDAALTAILPALLLVAPALAFLVHQERAKPTVVAKPLDPAAARALVSRVLAATGLLGAAVCAGAWLWSQQLPDRSDPPVRVDIAQLGNATPPLGAAILIGDVDFGRAVSKMTDRKSPEMVRTFYLPVIAAGSVDEPVRFFVDERTQIAGPNAPPPRFPDDRLRGVLVEGGLPRDMARMLTLKNVKIAEPYYLLLTGAEGARLSYHVVAGLAGLVATMSFALLAVVRLSRNRPPERTM